MVGSTDTNSEEGLGLGRKLEEKGATEKNAGRAEVVAETQETKEQRLSGSESESPSLLLTHWNTERHTAEGWAEKKGWVQREKETDLTGDKLDSESPSLLIPHWTPTLPAGRGTPEDTLNHTGTEAVEEERGVGLERESNAGEQQRCDGKANDKSSHTAVGPRVDQHRGRREKEEGRCNGQAGLAASCRLLEGLVFPPEYYVRTTRRMTSSQQQQQPDMQTSLFSNLIGARRSRGHGRSLHTLQDRQMQHAGEDTDKSNLRPVCSDMAPQMYCASSASSHEAQCSREEELDPSLDNPDPKGFLLAVPSARPMRGRKRKRGGKRKFEKGSFSLDISFTDQEQTSGHSVPALISGSPSQSFPVTGVLEQGPVSVAPVIVSQPSAFLPALPPGIPPSAQDDGPTPASGSKVPVYPIFKRSSSVTERPQHDVCMYLGFNKYKEIKGGIENYTSYLKISG